jgi:hypothetical protein
MGIIEIVIGLIIFLLLSNFVLALVPIPRGIAGTLVALLILYLVWSLVF